MTPRSTNPNEGIRIADQRPRCSTSIREPIIRIVPSKKAAASAFWEIIVASVFKSCSTRLANPVIPSIPINAQNRRSPSHVLKFWMRFNPLTPLNIYLTYISGVYSASMKILRLTMGVICDFYDVDCPIMRILSLYGDIMTIKPVKNIISMCNWWKTNV